jgi:two-component sensor histidine kinase
MTDRTVRKDDAGGEKTHSRPIAFYLVALVLAILIPALAVALVLLNRSNAAQQDVLRTLTNATVQAMGHSVDREVAGMATTLRVLSTNQSLHDGDLEIFQDRATQALRGTGTYLIAVDAQMDQLINTRVQYGTELDQTSDPETAATALESGRATISGLFFGETAQTYVFNVWLPVNEPGPVTLLALTQNGSSLSPALQSRQLPEGWNAALVDTDNLVIAATARARLATGEILPVRLGTEAQREEWLQENLNGEAVVTAEWRSSLTGWRVIAWASAAQVQRPFQESIWQLAAWGLIIAVAATAVAFLIAQRIGISVRGLRLDAQRLGSGQAAFPRDYPVRELAEVSEAIAEASAQRLTAERDIRFLMRELAHRSKNQMAVIAAMAKQTAQGAVDVPSYVASLERRIMGLARSTDLLLAHGRQGVSLAELIRLQLAPFCPPDEQRLMLKGDDLRINPQGAQILGMAMHELATNATRHGAFASSDGKVMLTWKEEGDHLDLSWREALNGPLSDSDRTGFGTAVLRTMVGGALNAEVDRKAHADGVEWSFRIPLSALDPDFAAIRPDEGREIQ